MVTPSSMQNSQRQVASVSSGVLSRFLGGFELGIGTWPSSYRWDLLRDPMRPSWSYRDDTTRDRFGEEEAALASSLIPLKEKSSWSNRVWFA